MEKETARPSTREFKVPMELLKTFQSDPRFIPAQGPTKGYIIFDMAMLKSVLLHGTPEARAELAGNLDKLTHAGGELAIMENPATQLSR